MLQILIRIPNMSKTLTGLERLMTQTKCQEVVKGNVGILCHSASLDSDFNHILELLFPVFQNRIKALFGPQHGIITDVQDNMVESHHFTHSYFNNTPVYSLYSETRRPTSDMLKGLDTMIIDLQDVGTRIYTYITTLQYVLQACTLMNIRVVVLDRPNPIGGHIVEGHVLLPQYRSFVGEQSIPVRHGMTFGEMARYIIKEEKWDCDLHVITLENWKRSLFHPQTNLPWNNPSPNLPTFEGALVFPGTVLFEGTTFSEGRGTTRSLEVIGHPKMKAYELRDQMLKEIPQEFLKGCVLSPTSFFPMFQKHANISCQGIFIHPTDWDQFRPWALGQALCHFLRHHYPEEFQWHQKKYEYEDHFLAIDYINGGPQLRLLHDAPTLQYEKIKQIEAEGMNEFLNKREQVLLYN